MNNQEPTELSRLIAIGSIVSVTDFTTEFESGDSFNIRGMKGIVTELYSEDDDGVRLTHAMIRWTADTIRSISEEYVSYCLENELCWTMTNLPLEALEIVNEPFDELELQWALNDKANEFFWHSSPEGRKLRSVFAAASPKDYQLPGDVLVEYLRKNLRLPMNVVISMESDPADANLPMGTKAELIAIHSCDYRMNIYAEISVEGRSCLLPLEDLEPAERGISKNARILYLYLLWVSMRQ